jgi:hypothetical protein
MATETIVRVHADWYPISALQHAIQEFRSFCTVACSRTADTIVLAIDVKPEAADETVDEFLNFALLAAIEQSEAGTPDGKGHVLS